MQSSHTSHLSASAGLSRVWACATAAARRSPRNALALACLGLLLNAANAADASLGLGSAFRPQTPPPVQALVHAASGAAAAASAGAGADAETAAGLRVVVSSPARTLATIDGRIVRVGDMVNGMRVMQISAQGVVLRGEAGARQDIKLNPTVIKRPANSTQVQTASSPSTPTQTQSRTGARP